MTTAYLTTAGYRASVAERSVKWLGYIRQVVHRRAEYATHVVKNVMHWIQSKPRESEWNNPKTELGSEYLPVNQLFRNCMSNTNALLR